MEIVLFAVLLAFAAGLVIYSVMPRRQDARDAVKRRLAGQRSVDEVAQIRDQARATATQSIVKRATPVLSRIVMPVSEEEQTQLRRKLASAGFRQRQAQTFFLASKSAVGILGLIAGAAASLAMGHEAKWLAALTIGGGALGFLLPGIWLSMATSSRQDKIRRGLPDILDLLVVSVESGLALDAALKRVGDEMAEVHSEISEEFRIATSESQMGIPRSEALENTAMRADVDELRALVSVIAQAERFGTSIARALRNQAAAMRSKRHLQAEEKAQKTAVKLMIPLVLFIFPAMGVVLAGPAAIRLMEAFAE